MKIKVDLSTKGIQDAIRQIQEETGVQIHGILSTDFLVKNKWILDFDKLTIRTTD